MPRLSNSKERRKKRTREIKRKKKNDQRIKRRLKKKGISFEERE